MEESIIVIIFLIFILLWANARYKNGFWKWIDDAMFYIDDYYKRAFNPEVCCFPKSEICKYTKIAEKCTPSIEPPPVSPKCPPNIFNFNCASGNSSAVPSIPIPVCPSVKGNPCECVDTEATFSGYRYVLDKLPGTIFKYKLNSNGCPDVSSKESIQHSLGSLTRIYVSDGKIIVEDIYSIEHIATVNTSNGYISF